MPYSLDYGPGARADVAYTRENEGYSRDHQPYGLNYDLRTLDDVVSHVRNASGQPECRFDWRCDRAMSTGEDLCYFAS